MSTSTLLLFRHSPIAYPMQYVWRAAMSRITDADTVWMERDTGCRDTQLIEVRVTGAGWKGYNAPERFTANGRLSTAKVAQLAPVWSIIRIETQPDTEKYGRWLSPLLVPIPAAGWPLGVTVEAADMVERDGVNYLDLAAHLVRTVPGNVWQTY